MERIFNSVVKAAMLSAIVVFTAFAAVFFAVGWLAGALVNGMGWLANECDNVLDRIDERSHPDPEDEKKEDRPTN